MRDKSDPFYERDRERRRAARAEMAAMAAYEATLPPDPDDDPSGLYGGGPEMVALRARAVRELLESPLCPGYPAPREPNVLLHLGSEIRRWVARFFQAL